MSEDKKLQHAKQVYKTLVDVLEGRKLNFQRNDERLAVEFGMSGEDIPMNFVFFVGTEMEDISVVSALPFSIPQDRRLDIAAAVAVANHGLNLGGFDYDYEAGDMIFRITQSWRGSIIGEELIDYMLVFAINIMDKYNDKFLMISKGIMTVEQLIESEKQ